MLKAELLKTVYLQNNGAEGFEMKTLPDEAQYAPVHAIAVLDVNSDGNKDLVLAGNEISTRINSAAMMPTMAWCCWVMAKAGSGICRKPAVGLRSVVK